ncbi:MAG: hypothetical protein M1840_006964 [Geoglossum simile]|nr:MAG: hypothetical protein M1840_006964 [Geoglossum simile]
MAFQYVPLNPTTDEIRLLTLHPGSPEAVIQCDVANTPLGDYSIHGEGIYRWSEGGIAWTRPKPRPGVEASEDTEWEISCLPTGGSTGDAIDITGLPQFRGETADMTGLSVVPTYEALSYTWGDHSATAPILVNGFELQVTVNLFRALQRLRKGGEKRVLWVDALCIDQSNLTERSEQVPRMRSIYQRAEQVVVWLGEAMGASDLAVDTLEGLGGRRGDMKDFIKGQGEWFGPQFDHFPGIGRGIKGGERQRVTEGLRQLNVIDPGDVDVSGMAAIERFFKFRDYWTRIWIIQEIAHARSIKIYCGSKSMGWETLAYTVYRDELRQGYGVVFNRLLDASGVRKLIGINWAIRQPMRVWGHEIGSTSFLQLLVDFRHHKCTDPRDKVYALLGLPSVNKSIPFPMPDYRKSVSTVYCETARAIIQYERALDILCLAHSDLDGTQHGLPSWAPDWTLQPTAVPLVGLGDRAYVVSGESVVDSPVFKSQLRQGEEAARNVIRDGTKGVKVLDEIKGKSSSQLSHTHHPPNDIYVLPLKGAEVDVLAVVGRSITDVALSSGEWRSVVREWEDMIDSDRNQLRAPWLQRRVFDFCCTLLKGRASTPEEPDVNWLEVLFEKYLLWSGRLGPESPYLRHQLMARLDNIEKLIRANIPGWKFATTAKGMMSMVPNRAREGDIIAILFGADVPFVLRPVPGNTGHFLQIGNAYVDGIMNGELMEDEKLRGLPKRVFTLV